MVVNRIQKMAERHFFHHVTNGETFALLLAFLLAALTTSAVIRLAFGQPTPYWMFVLGLMLWYIVLLFPLLFEG
ncbi:MAG TPA: hypothetical protein VE596_10215 [Gaiellaceae bacterium]|nr:hypothetical protein [Gaiellaceae bacterium]